MKKITILAAVMAFGLSLTSCSSDDNADAVAAPVLAGKWEFFKRGANVGGQEVFIEYTHTAGCAKDYFLLNADNTFADGWYEKNEANVCIEGKEIGSYTVANNVITFDYTNSSTDGKMEVLSITQSELKVKDLDVEEGENPMIYILTRG